MKLVESYAHRAAKDVVVGWLRDASQKASRDDWARVGGLMWRVNRGAPTWGIWQEYPILSDGTGATPVWDECSAPLRSDPELGYSESPPTFDELIAQNTPPHVILDIAVQSKGSIATAFEIYHKHPTAWEKRYFIENKGVQLIELDAKWVLAQVRPPTSAFPALDTSYMTNSVDPEFKHSKIRTVDAARRWLFRTAATIGETPQRSCNEILNSSSYACGRMVGQGLLDLTEAAECLYGGARMSGLDHAEARATITTGINAGLRGR